MRVLFVTHNFPRHDADVPGNFLLRLAVALQAHGVAVHVLAPHAPGLTESDVVEAVPVTRFRYAPDARETLAYGGTMAAQVAASWTARADLLRLIRAARRAVVARAGSADIVHAQWWFPAGLAAVRGHRLPVVTTLHGSDVRFGSRTALGRMLMRRTLRRSARVTAVSQWLAGEAARITGVSPVVAPMPVNISLFTPGTEPRSGLLFVGKVDTQKGLDVLLDALALLPDTLTLTVVGDGIDLDRRRAQAAGLGLERRVRWVGAQPQAALRDYYRRAQLMVAPASAPEGLGLVAVEALLCETPVVASDSGGLRDVVEPGVTGVLVPARDPRALAQAIGDAMSAPERLAIWGREGRGRMTTRFAPASCAAVYRDLYGEALRVRP